MLSKTQFYDELSLFEIHFFTEAVHFVWELLKLCKIIIWNPCNPFYTFVPDGLKKMNLRFKGKFAMLGKTIICPISMQPLMLMVLENMMTPYTIL